MTFQHRYMTSNDVKTCVEMIVSHPVLSARYGTHLADLQPAWLQVLESDAKSAIVFEQTAAGRACIWGFGISVFVGDGFIRELKTPPHFWVGPELVRRIVRGESPVLGYEQLREANSRDGLNLLIWEGFIRPDERKDPAKFNKMMSAFVEDHLGYRWKEIVSVQTDDPEHLRVSLKAGALIWDSVSQRWMASPTESVEHMAGKPYVAGLSCDRSQRQTGAWADILFDYHVPQMGFTRRQQHLLTRAMYGGTDAELSRELRVSLSTVKKTWRAIYTRTAASLPDLIPLESHNRSSDSGRGPQKKQHLLIYLQHHREELRPHVHRLIQSAGRR